MNVKNNHWINSMKNLEISDIQELCKEFDVEFSITTDNKDKLIIYNFGKVKWAKMYIESNLTWYDYINIIKRLSVTYPEKI